MIKPKVIIIAAGQGRRLSPVTEDTPKCLLKVGEKSILEYQLEVYRSEGIHDISLIKGFQKEKINFSGIKYFINDNYRNNNILNSLMCAENEMDGEFIAAYSDIIFEREVVRDLAASESDISVVVDTDWEKSYVGRSEHSAGEAEKVIFNEDHDIVEIGKIMMKEGKVGGEFIGMIKCSPGGAKKFRRYFHLAKEKFHQRPFIRAKNFEDAYLTDLIQFMVDQGEKVKCLLIKGGWFEIDTVEDFERVKAVLKTGGV